MKRSKDGCHVIVTGAVGKLELITDYSVHSFSGDCKSKVFSRSGQASNSSGRYQCMLKHYLHYLDFQNLAEFGPARQDRWAIQPIKERRALDDISAGRIERSIQNAKLSGRVC